MFTVIDRLVGMFSIDVGIDLGTANTLVCVPGKGVVLSEPSVVAVRKGTNEVLSDGDGMAVGDRAKEMLGKTPGNIQAIRPMKDGLIADFAICEAMLRYFIRKVHGNRRMFIAPRVVIAVPPGIRQVDRQAVIGAAERAGARKVFLVEQTMAAGIGLGLPIQEATASMLLDIGGGTSDVAVLALAGVVHATSIPIAGDEFDDAITAYMKNEHQLLVGPQGAERIKCAIGSAFSLQEEMQMTVKGRHVKSGLPSSVMVDSIRIRECLDEPLERITQAVSRTLAETQPELAADLVDRGLVICGGGALLRGIDRRLHERVDIPVKIGEEPLTAVARGTGQILDNLEHLKGVLESAETIS